MGIPMTVVEMTGTVDENYHLQLDGALPFAGPKRVRVLVLSSMTEDTDEWNETEWLKASLGNPAFAFLGNPEEDIYSLNDGKPFHDEA